MNIVMMVNVNKPKGGDHQRINDDHNCFDVSHLVIVDVMPEFRENT
jgi:hypothetical protein